jgi:uncharacterized membrane protein YfcA
VAFAALAASMIASIAGTGGGIIRLPVLVAVFGVHDAVPMYTLARTDCFQMIVPCDRPLALVRGMNDKGMQ